MKEKALIMRDLNSLPRIWVSWELGPPISQLAPVRQSLYLGSKPGPSEKDVEVQEIGHLLLEREGLLLFNYMLLH